VPFSGLTPHCAVVVATIRALKCHGGAPIPIPGRPMPPEYGKENVGWVEKGCANLVHHINTVRKAGINPVVCINAFYTDTKAEIAAVRRIAEKAGARVAVSEHWLKGGEGALEFADAVADACKDKPKFKFLYDLKMPISKRIDKIAKTVYGASGVEYSADAQKKIERMEKDPVISKLGLCMVKTHLSLSDNPAIKGVPKGWKLFVRDVLVYGGAGFVVPVAGTISLMPGTASDPAFKRVDVDTKTGKVKGLF
jgi:formyltetrahydrofolate synthetase